MGRGLRAPARNAAADPTHARVATRRVRAPASQNKPFKGPERRAVPRPAGQAQTHTQAAAKPFKSAAPAPAAAKPKATTVTAKAAPAGGDDEWETF